MNIQINLPRHFSNGDEVPYKYLDRLIASVVAATGRVSVIEARSTAISGKTFISEPVLLIQATYNLSAPKDWTPLFNKVRHIATVAAGVLKQENVYLLFDGLHYLVEQDDAVRADVRAIVNG